MLIQFFYGLFGSIIGGVAFGPVNLSVVELTIKKNLPSANRFCLAAALVEIGQAFIAILFGKLISRKIEEFPELKLLVILFFFHSGLILRTQKETSHNLNSTLPDNDPVSSTASSWPF
ncbi:MAG: hypothetical protein U5K79_24895 [Cyclobacteriaceae bacterium]|nr:hypothetical protein [Cyclobacteriaceae bacterium]